MKKLLFLLLAFVITLNFTACSNDDDDKKVVTTTQGSVTFDGKTYTIKSLAGVLEETTSRGQEMSLIFRTNEDYIFEVTIADDNSASNWYDGVTYTTMAEYYDYGDRYCFLAMGEKGDADIFIVEYGKNKGNVKSVVNTYENNSDVLRIYGEARAYKVVIVIDEDGEEEETSEGILPVEFDVYATFSDIEAKKGVTPWD